MNPHATVAIFLIIALLALTHGYAFACWIWPFKACPRCSGSGKKRSPSGRAFRLCRRCEGTGRRLRAGERVPAEVESGDAGPPDSNRLIPTTRVLCRGSSALSHLLSPSVCRYGSRTRSVDL